MSFKQLCSPVATITGPWNCVLYRDIHLLKAHSRSRNFSSNCVGDAAPKPHLLNARARGLHWRISSMHACTDMYGEQDNLTSCTLIVYLVLLLQPRGALPGSGEHVLPPDGCQALR